MNTTTTTYFLTGSIWATDDSLGHLGGELCMADTWEIARETGEIALLVGKTNGKDYTLDLVLGGDVVGKVKYSKLSLPINGLIARGTMDVGTEAFDISVFTYKAKPRLVQVTNEDGTIGWDSVSATCHRFRAMTREEVAKYTPTKAVAIGSMM